MLIYLLSHFSWNKLTERFFKTSPWPEAEAIASLVGNGEWYLLRRGIRLFFSLLTWACCLVCYRCGFHYPLQGAVLQAHLRQSQRECVCTSVSLNDNKSLCEYSCSPLDGVSAVVWCEQLSILRLFFIYREVQLLTRGLSPTTITATSSTTFSVSTYSSFTCDGITFG